MLLAYTLWPNYGLCGGSDGTGRDGKRKAAVVLVLLAKDVVSLQINTEIDKHSHESDGSDRPRSEPNVRRYPYSCTAVRVTTSPSST